MELKRLSFLRCLVAAGVSGDELLLLLLLLWGAKAEES